MIEVAIRDYLLELTGVTTIVATNPVANDKEIRPNKLHRTDTLPGIILIGPHEEPLSLNNGYFDQTNANFQILCMATTQLVARDLAEAVRVGLDEAATIGSPTDGTAFAISAIRNSTESSQDELVDGSDESFYTTAHDYDIVYRDLN